jgi:hypothetical protein
MSSARKYRRSADGHARDIFDYMDAQVSCTWPTVSITDIYDYVGRTGSILVELH